MAPRRRTKAAFHQHRSRGFLTVAASRPAGTRVGGIAVSVFDKFEEERPTRLPRAASSLSS